MFKINLKIALRNLVKNKVSSFVNIGGLAAGMAVAILIGLWIYDEVSFNSYHQNYKSIGQIMLQTDGENGKSQGGSLQYPLSSELKTNYKNNFKYLVTASWVQDYVLSAGDKKISGIGQYMEQEAPAMLTLKMLYGNWNGLKDLYSIMLSSSLSTALFGNADPINKTVKINNKYDVKVTGVYEDLPLNTSFHNIQFFSPFDLWVIQNDWIKKRAVDDWTNHFLRIYAQTKPGDDFSKVSHAIRNAEMKNLANFKEEASHNPQILIRPMSEWHLHPVERGKVSSAPLNMVWLVGATGLFVLILACINFMNLSTARSEKRAKEVGIRKAVGSMRRQLIYQFFSESFLVVILAFVIALLVVSVSLPWFNNLAAKQMALPLANGSFWAVSLAFIFITGLLAGSYPAFYLSSFKPVKVLKGTFRVGRLASLPRKVLVVTQFTVSAVLIICTIIVYRQVQFSKSRDMGYSAAGLISLEMKSDDFYGKDDILRNELKKTGVVDEMSESMGKVTELSSNNGGFNWKGKDPKADPNFGTLAISPEYGKTVGWQFITGRDFLPNTPGDSTGLVINETAAKYMALKNPVGEEVTWTWWQNNNQLHYKILGVIKDMVMESPYKIVEPTVFYIKGHNGGVNWINIKMKKNVAASVALPKIEAVFKKIIPSAPFDYKFMDEEYAAKFAAEERTGKLSGFFTTLAIFISCLGLFGLSSFVAEQRQKEIGIRKVLGASVFNLWRLLSKDFMILVVISLLIASPAAYYFMHSWLQNYEYRTEMSWWIFAAAGGGALVITLLTVSWQSIAAALMNPVKSLKTE